MTDRTVVIRRKSLNWQPKTKRKLMPLTSAPKTSPAGFINPVLVVLACTAFSALFYIYSVNQTAVKGIEIRNVEKEIAGRRKDNESLRIKEAELKSLYHIEEQSKELGLVGSTAVRYVEESPSVAYGNVSNGNKN